MIFYVGFALLRVCEVMIDGIYDYEIFLLLIINGQWTYYHIEGCNT